MLDDSPELDRFDDSAAARLMLRGVLTNFYKFAGGHRDNFDVFFLRGDDSDEGVMVHKLVERAFIDKTAAALSEHDPSLLVTEVHVGLRVINTAVGDREGIVGVTYLGELLDRADKLSDDTSLGQLPGLPINQPQV